MSAAVLSVVPIAGRKRRSGLLDLAFETRAQTVDEPPTPHRDHTDGR
jgi:hypothetical protein